MPFVSIKIAKGRTTEQKQALAKSVAKWAVVAQSVPPRRLRLEQAQRWM